MNQVGDLLFSLPALYNLRARFPDSRIVSVVRPACADLLRMSGLVDEIIERPRQTDIRVIRLLRKEHLDFVLLFSTSCGIWALALASGAKRRIGFVHSMSGFLLHKSVPWSPPPSTANNLRLVEAIGCTIVKSDYVGLIKPPEAEMDAASRILHCAGIEEGKPFAVIAPGTSTGKEIKRWPDERFAETADRLADEMGIRSAVIGLDGGNRVCRLSRNIADLTGGTSLPMLAAVLQKAKVFIGVDSGAMHLAAAVGTPVVGLFGPTDHRITGPQGEGHAVVTVNADCSPCFRSECNLSRKCMEGITAEMVFSKAALVINQ
jgi:ADP-heptose:LPS heptosyltransferase